ncbi:MAG: hypothetical protein DLM61_03800 [Pseudonocardiales bacterium]|nr:MAG: hypothetical protein DLM61_03800 [Pseudonocardiales bacterium]
MSQPGRGEKPGLAGIAAAGLAVVCCAAGPLLFAWVGSVAVGALVGLGAGLAVLAVAVALLYMRRRSSTDKQASR